MDGGGRGGENTRELNALAASLRYDLSIARIEVDRSSLKAWLHEKEELTGFGPRNIWDK